MRQDFSVRTKCFTQVTMNFTADTLCLVNFKEKKVAFLRFAQELLGFIVHVHMYILIMLLRCSTSALSYMSVRVEHKVFQNIMANGAVASRDQRLHLL